jgi:CRP-like cAMP-binding protein
VPAWDRHALVNEAFNKLADNETLRFIYDYEPRPLRRMFDSTGSQRFRWHQRRLACDRWEVALCRLPPPPLYESTIHFMNRCPVFAEASESTKTILASFAHVRNVRRKATIVEQEADWPFVGVVRKGRVFAIAGGLSGREQILYEVLESDVFGNMTFFDGGVTMASFVTLAEEAELLLFPRANVAEAAAADSRFALALGLASTQQMRSIVDLIQARVSMKTVARVAAAILPYASAERGLTKVDHAQASSLRLAHIAKATGTVKEVVARALGELETAGAVCRVRGRIAFLDRQALAKQVV